MSSVFTVAVDLSKIKKATPVLYHVLVDPLQMSVFIEFVELVRSMFNITEHIRFLHDSKYIHFLEDIRILSVIQLVQAECYVPDEIEKERMELLIKTLKFYDRSQKFPKILLNRLRINYDNHTGEIIGVDNKTDENSDDELLDISQNKLDSSNKENSPKEKEITSQIQLLAIEAKKPVDATNNFNINNQNPKSQKHMNISEVDNIIPDQEKKWNFRRSQINRPFTLGGLLETLRNEASTSNNFPKEEPLSNSYDNSAETRNDFNSTIEDEQDNEEETSNNDSINKKRKRVRKHRSRKRKQNIPNSNSTPNETFESSEALDEPETEVPSKMRHVRFDYPDDPEENLADANAHNTVVVNNGNITVDQVWQELQQKKNILENGPKEDRFETNTDNVKVNGEETDCIPVNTKSENKTNNVPMKTLPPELNGLLTFRKNNLSPVVFKRSVVFNNETF